MESPRALGLNAQKTDCRLEGLFDWRACLIGGLEAVSLGSTEG
jgi:hypothetical protein